MHITLISSQSQLAFHSCSSERKRPRSIASIMASKALLVLALLLAANFLVASANEQAQAKEEKAEVQDWHGGGGGYPGGGGGGGGGYPGGHCRWGCCNRGYHGGCRCCSHPDQIPEPMYRPELVVVHN